MSKDEVPFRDHIKELGSRLKIVLYTIAGATGLFMALPADMSFLQNPPIFKPLVSVMLNLIREDVLPPAIRLIGGQLTTPLELYVIASFALGVGVSLPVVAFQIYRFIDPALYPEERSAIYPFLTAFLSLFIIGAVFGYKILAPFMIWALLPFFEALQVEYIVFVTDFYILIFILTLLTGLTFTFPVFFVLLVKFGIIRTEIVTKNRKYVYAGAFVLTAVVTPDGGPLADLALFLPVIILLESGIMVAKRYEKKAGSSIVQRSIFTQSPKCINCNSPLDNSKQFCSSCGTSQT